jgi:hypothetical protein
LTIVTEKWRITDDAIKDALQLGRKFDGLLKVILNELFENGKALIILKEGKLWFACTFSRVLLVLVFPCEC